VPESLSAKWSSWSAPIPARPNDRPAASHRDFWQAGRTAARVFQISRNLQRALLRAWNQFAFGNYTSLSGCEREVTGE